MVRARTIAEDGGAYHGDHCDFDQNLRDVADIFIHLPHRCLDIDGTKNLAVLLDGQTEQHVPVAGFGNNLGQFFFTLQDGVHPGVFLCLGAVVSSR